MNVILIGYRGSGKTTLGRRLADRLWWKFIDLDDQIIQNAGLSIKDIFARHGENHFRDLETNALRNILPLADHVIALGGGAPMRQENQALLKQSGHKIIYLHCDPQTLLQRIQSDANTALTRPSLTTLGGGLQEIQHLLAQRLPVYRELASAELDVTHLTAEEAIPYLVRMI